jgi:hypothetical protein
MVSSPESS